MSLSDFWDNVTDPHRVGMLLEDLVDCTREFGRDMADLCENEGMEIVRETPAALAELGEILAPLHNPTPANVIRTGLALKRALSEENAESSPDSMRLLPPPE
jgi:hypothetical protein